MCVGAEVRGGVGKVHAYSQLRSIWVVFRLLDVLFFAARFCESLPPTFSH
jgi:hypothetical protein